jgi:ferredoxin-NADP reductase
MRPHRGICFSAHLKNHKKIMTEFKVKILDIGEVTHDVKRFTLEKPEGYTFNPGQATEVAINKPGLDNERRPFTFTGLNESPTLEFIIKGYATHNGVTKALHELKVGDELLIHDVWGAIEYKGKGVFIAGGAGITPFIAILRQLSKDKEADGNKLIFSNKTMKDVILKDELEKILGDNFIKVITDESIPGIYNSWINKDFLKETIQDFNQHFYICGPEKFTEAIQTALVELGAKADAVVFEK